jgi:putative DNA methylase
MSARTTNPKAKAKNESAPPETRAIEAQSFPFEHLSEIAELESWRKEINRPIYHIHKWWAQRLGSVFRAIILATFSPKESNVLDLFYQPVRFPDSVVFDPFMGSGTTLGEALKLGARAIGRDINPVSHFIVRNALGVHPCHEVIEAFRDIEREIAPRIRKFYQARLSTGELADVLYYFWVKVVDCPKCEQPVDLFSSYIFAQHAYPERFPEAHAICPHCGVVNTIRYDVVHSKCVSCHKAFKPREGPASGASATCPKCAHTFPIAKTVQKRGCPPRHRLYAKLVTLSNDRKEYLPADEYDHKLYGEASSLLRERQNVYPIVQIQPGYNTNQALNYCYTHWHQMFNDRQLLCLGLLAERIRAIKDKRLRELFACLLSGTLEFNNMFASYKGEGTGAVRHMFSHHILKPERMPLEANIWGTPKSSGSFSTLFESRILRALAYCEKPFEIRVVREGKKASSEKVYHLCCPLGQEVAESFEEFQQGNRLYLSCGDSSTTDLPSESVDAVLTDPPFFDNVHYSQLADFFYVWQRHVLGGNGIHTSQSTRSPSEVQQSDPRAFTARLQSVLAECNRVLRPQGLLAFTYHHSRAEGWRCILEAIIEAGFVIVAAHPIKSEMSVAQPKHQAKEPIDLDVILACRKRSAKMGLLMPSAGALTDATREAQEQVDRFNNTGRMLSLNDVRVVLMAQVIKRLSSHASMTESVQFLKSHEGTIEAQIQQLHRRQQKKETSAARAQTQTSLWSVPSAAFRFDD